MKQIKILSALILVIFVLGCTQQSGTGTTSGTGTQSSGTGRAVFAITDAAANMGAVTSVKVTVDSVKVHSAAQGWVTVSSSSNTYDLLELKGSSETALLADAQLKEDTYDQVRLDISKVIVTDSSGTNEAKLPSGELKIDGKLVVGADSTSAAIFDFIADESLHVTGNGKYIMAPVVKLETKENADVSVKSGNKVQISGGKIDTSVKVGMDANGNVGVGVMIPPTSDVSIDAAGVIKAGKGVQSDIGASLKGNTVFTISDAAANMGNITSVKVTIDGAKAHSNARGWFDVSTTSQTFDLLELKAKGTQSLLASADIEPGIYEQVRLDISKVIVTDSSGDHEAKLPSGEIKISGILVVNSGSTTTANFDFIADESLHVTGNGEYILAPVIKLETRENANVEAKSGNSVEVTGGNINSNAKVGMDIDGNVGIDRTISKESELSIESGKIKLKSKVVVSMT